MSNKFILYLDGGAMSGIFAGGVVNALEDLNIYPQIEAIYAASAGAFNAAYFLAKQTKEGQEIYLHHMRKNFIYRWNLIPGIPQRLWHRFIKPVSKEKTINAVDIDYILKLIKEEVPLRIENIFDKGIPFYIQVLNLETKQSESILADRNNIYDLLKASACIAPYTFENVAINGKRYIDGTIKDPMNLKYLLEKYPNDRIILITAKRGMSQFRHQIESFLEGSIASLMYGKEFLKIFTQRERLSDENFKLAKDNSRIYLINAPSHCPVRPRTKEHSKLFDSMEMGKEAGMKIKEILDN
ncbi:MAG: patatin-like phospholipase family protein [Candidatus Paceibacterota bacterium]|jgi:predicted acylesterase/phospholipase RssA